MNKSKCYMYSTCKVILILFQRIETINISKDEFISNYTKIGYITLKIEMHSITTYKLVLPM